MSDNNERQIKPLRRYDLTFKEYSAQGGITVDSFTADDHFISDRGHLHFLNAGNVIRTYFEQPYSMIITPVEEE